MSPLDKEVAEWMEGLGFRLNQTVDGVQWIHPSSPITTINKKTATLFYTATKQAELKARKAEHQSWSIVYGIGYDSDNERLPENVLTLRQKWSRDELEINAQLNNSNKENE